MKIPEKLWIKAMDLIRQLGVLAFGSRLRRLNERLSKDVSRIYRDQGIGFEVRWFPVFYLLTLESELSITGIALVLQYTHPAINQIAGEMDRAGLIVSTRDKNDERRRLLSLSKKGRSLIPDLKPLWADIVDATKEILSMSGIDFVAAIDKVEEALDQRQLYDRIVSRIKIRQYDAIEIVEYESSLKDHFRELNYEWLKKYYRIEPADEKVLGDPEGNIISNGGAVVFARIDGKIIGTGALIKHDDQTYEIAKMAVTERMQRRQAGKKLTRALLDRALDSGAVRIFLETGPQMTPAISLYEKLGFEISEGFITPRYKRESITMVYKFEK